MTDTQISVGMNVDGVVTGTEKAKRKISELGGAAREAGKGTGAIGDGMAGAATKVEAATKNMVGSIQRQIAALEAGDKSSRQYQESLARMRGIDVAALRPYLDQLDQMKLKQADAAAQQAHLAEGMGLVRSAALAGAAAVMAAAAGFVAFAKSSIDAADGMNDLSQRVGISVKELGKYQLAAEQSGTSMDAIAKGVKGLAENMSKHGDALRKIGIDSKTADGAMQQLADVFAAMPDGMEKTTLATKMFGKAGMDLIPMLNLGSKGLAEAAEKSAKFADQMALAAPMADAFNDSMAEIGMYTKVAGMAMVNDMLPVLVEITKAMADAAKNGGILQGVMAGVGVGIDNYWKNVRSFYGMKPPGAEGQWSEGNASGSWEAPKKADGADAWMAKYKEFMAAIKDGSGTSGTNKALAELNKELSAQSKILAELSGYTADYEATQQRYAAMLKSGAMSQEAYNRAAQELVAKQPGMVAAAKAQAESQKEITKTHADYVASLQKSVIAGDEELAKAQAAYDAHGKLASVLQEELIARMEITRDQIAGGAGSEAELSAIDAQIKAKRELVKVLRSGEVRDASEKAAKDAAAEWKKASEKIEQDITDALMRGFESGKGFAEVLRDTIENTFKTMVIRPVIQATVQGGLNAVGLGSAQGGGTINGIGGAINTANSMNSIYAAGSQFLYGSSVGASAASLAAGNMAGMVGGDALGTMIAANGSWAGVSAGTAAGTAAAGTAATGAGAASSLASAGPYVAAAIAAYMIADSLFGSKGGPKSDSSYNMGGFGDASATGLAGTYATGVEDAWKTLAKELEITTALQVGALTSIDTQGDAKTILRANATVDGVGVYDRATRMGTAENVGRSQEELQAAMAEETTRILFAALKASDLPEQYKTYLSTIGDSVADMTEAMTIVAVVDDFNDALQSLPFENLKTLSFAAAKGLIEVAGGMDVLGANLGTYYTNFYSAEEQRLQTIKTINAATAGSGLDAATATRDQFRQIVEAQDLTTESGRGVYAALLAVSGSMGQLITESEKAASAVEDTAKAFQDMSDTAMQGVENALSALSASVEAQKADLQASYAAQLESYTAQLDAVTESVGKLKSLSDSLKNTLDGMRVSGSDTAYRAAAQAQISAALATARTGGALPLDGQLTSALATVSKPSEQLFATFEDYARDFYKTANDIASLSGLTDKQLTASEQLQQALETQISTLKKGFDSQIKALDDILDAAEKQVDALDSLNVTGLSIAESLAALAQSIGALKAINDAKQTEALGGSLQAYAESYASQQVLEAVNSAVATPMSEYEKQINALYKVNLGREADAGGLAGYAASGLDLAAINDILKNSAEATVRAVSGVTAQNAFNEMVNAALGQKNRIKAYAIGTNYVPYDQVAQIHEGERIIPAADNRELMARLQNPQQNNAELVAEIRALRQEVASLKASNEATAANTKKFAQQFETASEGGRALLTEVYA